jgi:iron-sulfur cluster assembly accessory protein
MQTSTYQPYTLPQATPPPSGNTGSVDSSIAGNTQDARPPKETGLYDFSTKTPSVEKSSISAIEQDVQQFKSTIATTQPPKAKPRQKLRARKAAMTLTSSAVEQLKARLDQPTPKLIKIGVRNRGCSGLAYDLEFIDKPGMFDEVVEQDGVKVVIDSKALLSVLGTEMDWEEDKLNQKFVFNNPNISKLPYALS